MLKKTLLIAAIGLLIVPALVIAADDNKPARQGPRMQRGGWGPFAGLDLTDEQRQEIRDIMEAQREQTRQAIEDVLTDQQKQQIEQRMEQAEQRREQARQRRQERQDEELTDEQREQARQIFLDAAEKAGEAQTVGDMQRVMWETGMELHEGILPAPQFGRRGPRGDEDGDQRGRRRGRGQGRHMNRRNGPTDDAE